MKRSPDLTLDELRELTKLNRRIAGLTAQLDSLHAQRRGMYRQLRAKGCSLRTIAEASGAASHNAIIKALARNDDAEEAEPAA